jgi:RNA polymerase sigma-70 factor (ECF subfamily)
MTDEAIIALYQSRDEAAISETQRKYSGYLSKIAYNVVGDSEDSAEAVNDTYLAAWNAIPPHEPVSLPAFLGKIARRIAVDAFRKRTAAKRQSTEYALSLNELGDCVSSPDNRPEHWVEAKLLGDKISDWLETLSPEMSAAFVRRYYFADSVKAIAARSSSSESKVKSMLHRARIALKSYLEQEDLL